jgi:hypothetical protein
VQEAERMKIYDEIDDLLANCRKCPKHNPRGYYIKECRGCSVLDELQALGKQLYQKKPRKQEERIRSILEKGQDMTTSEVRYLIKNGVTQKRISHALGMDPNTFGRLLENMKRGWRHEPSKAF